MDETGNTKGGLFDWFGIGCMTTDNFGFYLQNRLIQTSQTGGQWYSDTSPFSIPWMRLFYSFKFCLFVGFTFETFAVSIKIRN